MTKILLIGLGKMGQALFQGWSRSQNATHPLMITTVDPHHPDADYAQASDAPADFDVVVLAVKPQIMADVVTPLQSRLSAQTLVLSIAAGKTITFYESLLSGHQPVIRAMPNTPALIGQGITVLCGNAHVTPTQQQTATELLSAVGLVEWITDESLMDAVTAVSGSGPAYVFHLIEAMAEAGIDEGLPASLAGKLARQTVIGAAALAASRPEIDAATLRQNVTSPGGTTEAALKILQSGEPDNLTTLMTKAVKAATLRGRTLAQPE